jgi:hypothetical protein
MALMLAELPSRYGAEGCQYLKTLLRTFRATRLADYGRLFERIMTEKKIQQRKIAPKDSLQSFLSKVNI